MQREIFVEKKRAKRATNRDSERAPKSYRECNESACSGEVVPKIEQGTCAATTATFVCEGGWECSGALAAERK